MMKMPKPNTRMTSEDDFIRWIYTSRAGERCIYHTGFTAAEARSIGVSKAARRAANDGKVHLVQRRYDDSDQFDFIAQRKA